jgi:CHAT domain-containing protein
MKKLYVSSILGLFLLLCQFSNVNAQTWKELMDSCEFYQEKQNFEIALKWVKLALPQAEKEFGKNDSNFVSTLGTVARVYYSYGYLDSAVYYGDLRVKIARELFKNDNIVLASCINSLAVFYKSKGDFERVESLYKESLEIRKRLFKGDNPDVAKSMNNLAIFYQEQGKLNLAEPLFFEALQMMRRVYLNDNNDLARLITSMGYLYFERSDYKQAEQLFKEALDMRRRLFTSDHSDLARSINNIATFYNTVGDYRQAEPLLKEVLEMRRRLFKRDHPDLAVSINNSATFYYDMGDFKMAEALFIEALEMRRRLFKNNNKELANSINNLAFYYCEQRNFILAEPLFIEALAMNRQIYKSDSPDLASSINNLANFYDATKDSTKAKALFVEAIDMYRRIYKYDHPNLATSINNMAGFYHDRGSYEQAEKLYKESLEMRRRLYKLDHNDLTISLNNLADFYCDINNNQFAENYFKEAMLVYKNIIKNYFPSLSEKEKNLFWKTCSKRFEAFNSFGVERLSENPQITCNMYDMQLYTKALLFNSTAKIKKRIMNSNDLALIDRYNEFISKKEWLIKLYSMTEDTRKAEGINLDSIEKLTNDIEKELSLKSELYPISSEQTKVTWKSVQSLLKPDEAAVEVIRFRYRTNNRFTDTIYYAFLIVTDQMEEHPDIIVLENGANLENEYYNYYRARINGRMEDKLSFDRYWGKLKTKLNGYKKIYFSADGIYNKLNPATLLMPNGGYLLDEQDIQQVNSTKDLIIGFHKLKDESNTYNSAILIGNPNFSLSEASVSKATAKIREQNDYGSSYSKIATRQGIDLDRLPGTEKEIKDIEKFLNEKKWDVKCYLGDKALKAAMKSASSPRILHIATHGMFLEDINLDSKETFGFDTKKVFENPLLRSGLFFTGADNFLNSDSTKPIGDENGLLTAYEAMNLDLDRTELVVLSACETGLGDVKNGEGVFGLRRAFQQAGAKAVIMSLWEVNDIATQKVMSSFYSNWVTGMNKREAFSNAQKEVRKEFPEPYYWGAFVMVGE